MSKAGNAAARPVRHAAVVATGRSRACGTRSTSLEATMPMTPRCQPSPPTTSTLWAPTSGSVSTIFRAARRCPLPLPAAGCSRRSSCSASARASSAIASSTASSSRAAMSGELMRPAALTRGASRNADVEAVERLARAGRDASSSARSPTVCGPRESRSRPSLAMTRFSPTSGTTSASVPMAAIFTNAGSQLLAPVALAQRLHQLRARRRRRRGACRDSGSRGASGLMTASAGGSSRFGLVMIGDDQIEPELARAARRRRALRMPQSTDTITPRPSACSRSIAGGCRP